MFSLYAPVILAFMHPHPRGKSEWRFGLALDRVSKIITIDRCLHYFRELGGGGWGWGRGFTTLGGRYFQFSLLRHSVRHGACHSRLLFCSGRLKNEQRFITHVHIHCSACSRCRRGLPKFLYCRQMFKCCCLYSQLSRKRTPSGLGKSVLQ